MNPSLNPNVRSELSRIVDDVLASRLDVMLDQLMTSMITFIDQNQPRNRNETLDQTSGTQNLGSEPGGGRTDLSRPGPPAGRGGVDVNPYSRPDGGNGFGNPNLRRTDLKLSRPTAVKSSDLTSR